MLNPRLCSKCPFAKIHQPEYDEKGNKVALWCVDCSASQIFDLYHIRDCLYIDDEPPPKCPYILEHSIAMQDVTDEEKEYLSNIEESE